MAPTGTALQTWLQITLAMRRQRLSEKQVILGRTRQTTSVAWGNRAARPTALRGAGIRPAASVSILTSLTHCSIGLAMRKRAAIIASVASAIELTPRARARQNGDCQ